MDTKDTKTRYGGWADGDELEALRRAEASGKPDTQASPPNAMVASALKLADELDEAVKLLRDLAKAGQAAHADMLADGSTAEQADKGTNAGLGLMVSVVIRPAIMDALNGHTKRGLAIVDPDGSMLAQARAERRRSPLDF